QLFFQQVRCAAQKAAAEYDLKRDLFCKFVQRRIGANLKRRPAAAASTKQIEKTTTAPFATKASPAWAKKHATILSERKPSMIIADRDMTTLLVIRRSSAGCGRRLDSPMSGR